jgi:hypothetical protein
MAKGELTTLRLMRTRDLLAVALGPEASVKEDHESGTLLVKTKAGAELVLKPVSVKPVA